MDPEILIEDQKRLADGVDDLFGELLLVLQQPPAAPLLRHILDGDEKQGRAIAGARQRSRVQQHGPLADASKPCSTSNASTVRSCGRTFENSSRRRGMSHWPLPSS